VAQSAQLSAAASLAAGALVLVWTGRALASELEALVRAGLSRAAAGPPSGALHDAGGGAGALALDALTAAARLSWPIATAAAAAAAAGGLIQTRARFTLAPLAPDLRRIDPVAGLGRMWSLTTAVTLTRLLLVLLALALVAWDLAADHAGD